MRLLQLSIMLFICLNTLAQRAKAPCSAPEASQFDFWIGEWQLTWGDTAHGTNHIEKLYGNCTVHENFSNPIMNYYGQSWSVYNTGTQQWQQTWIDNQGAYIVLNGKWEGDRMVLKTNEIQGPTGKRQMRMVYYHIQQDSFDWSWDASTDGGITWKPAWQIHYTRKK